MNKEKASMWTALIAFVCGWGLTIAGFIVSPLGEVSNSVLAILGEAMVYCASVFGIAFYFKRSQDDFKADMKAYIKKHYTDESTD